MVKITKEKKNGILLTFGRWTSRLGNVVFDYINNVSLANLNRKNSILVAIYQASETIFSIILNLFAGTVADKTINKKKLIVLTDFISGLLCIILSFFLDSCFIAIVIIIANCILAIVNAFNSPLYRTLVRNVISKENIALLNSISNAGIEAISLIGPLIGLWCVKQFGVRSGLVFNGVTFLVSSLLESRILIMENENNIGKSKNILKDLVDGFVYLVHDHQMIHIFVFASFVNFFCAGSEVFMPYTNQIFDSGKENVYATILISQGIAGLIGSFVSAGVSRFLRNNIKKIQFISVLVGLSYCSIFMFEKMKFACLIYIPFILISFLVTIYNIQYMTYIQEIVDELYVGRIFSLLKISSAFFVPVGAFVFTAVCNTNSSISFILTGIGISIISLISIILM